MKGKKRRAGRRVSFETRDLTGRQRRYYFAVTAVLACVVFEVYGRALHGPFLYDDFSLPFYKPRFPTEAFSAWTAGVRPLLMFSYWVNFQLSGADTYSYHILNLILHLVNSSVVFLIVRRILGCEQIERWQLDTLSVFAAALFLLHPVQTESVAYIAGRSEALSAFFLLCAFTVFLYRSSPSIDWRRSALIFILFACALASKEHTAVLPILLLITDLFWSSEQRISAVRRNWRLYLPILCGGLLATGLIWMEINASTSVGDRTGVNWLTYATTECRVLFLYLRLLLIPVGQNLDHDVPWSSSRFELGTFIPLLGIMILATIAWRLRKRFPVGSYGFLIFLLLLTPTSSFIPIKDAVAEHRLYLPMLGLVLVACEFLLHLCRERRTTVAVASALIVAAAIVTYHRNRVWASEAALWEDTVTKSPNKVRGYGHLVHGLVREHRCREAIHLLSDAARRISPDAALLANWSFAYECVNEPEHALEKLEQSAAMTPWPSTFFNMARQQITLHRTQDAVQSLNRALELDPSLESAYAMRAGILEGEGNFAAASRDYEAALRLNPGDGQAFAHLQRISGGGQNVP
jgi:protein O-mannosyl-transferase